MQSEGERPKSPKVFGILSIVFASITLLFSLISFLGTLAGAGASDLTAVGALGSGVDEALVERFAAGIGGVYTAGVINTGLMVLFSGLLLAIGIGQVGYRRWSGPWSVYWGAGALVALAVMITLLFTMVTPFYDSLLKLASSHARDLEEARVLASVNAGPMIGLGGAVFMVFVLAPYPVLLLAFFTRPRVRAALDR